MPIFALAGGSWLFLGFVVIFLFVLVFAYYTRRGSGISQTPYADQEGTTPETPSDLAHDKTQHVSDWQHGVGGHHGGQHGPGRVEVAPELAELMHRWRDGSGHGNLEPAVGEDDEQRGEGAVTICVYWDYSEPECGELAKVIADLRAQRRVVEVARHLPIADAREMAWPAALAAEASREQGQFWWAHDSLLEKMPSDERSLRASVTPEPLEPAEEASRKRIVSHVESAIASGAHAVPSIFIDGRRYDAEPDIDGLRAAVDAASAD